MPKLKGIARKALRVGGRGIGGFFGGPAGAAIGGRLGNYASRMFEMELEGLSPEDQEFEIAKRFVRFAGSAIDNAENQGANGQPNQVANDSIEEAARVHAPGLLKSSLSRRPSRSSSAGNGKWIKRGNKIILFGVS